MADPCYGGPCAYNSLMWLMALHKCFTYFFTYLYRAERLTAGSTGQAKGSGAIPRLSRKSGNDDLFSASMRTPARYGDFDDRTCSTTDIEMSAEHSGDNGWLFAPLLSHVFTSYNTHTQTHTRLTAHLSTTTQVSWYQKRKTNLDFTEARESEWQWHQLGHM